jgi:hypothetical protein
MKAHTHYTTPIATAPWMRRNVAALAALLALAAALIGLTFALGRFGQQTNNALGSAAASSARPLSATCRECADEVLGAAQISQGSPAPHTVDSAVRQHIVAPRVFRDEMLGADQANLAFLSIDAARQPSQVTAPAVYQRLEGPRAFRDDVLGADQANLASLAISGGTALGQQAEPRQVGPR